MAATMWTDEQRYEQRIEPALTVEEQLELVRREQEALERRVRLIEDLIAAIRRDEDASGNERR